MLFHCYYFELDLKRNNNDYARVKKVGESLEGITSDKVGATNQKQETYVAIYFTL